MKNATILFLIFSAILCSNSYSQTPQALKKPLLEPNATTSKIQGNAKITGYVLDSLLTKPVEFANVSLYSNALKKVIDGTVCDEKGKFILKNIKDGSYELSVTFLGYKNYKKEINLEAGQLLDLGVIKLFSDEKTLKEVIVQGQKALIEEKVDRTIYNAEKDQNNKGGDATDVLRKVPMLSVDLEGNVMLRGNSNIKVLINNKPSTILSTNIADALKQLPADMIKTVEVITSPSAKYDAEGSSGIINIITKKNNLQGFTLSEEISFGVRGSNLSLNGSLRKKNIGFSLGGFGRASYNTDGDFVNNQTNIGIDGVLNRSIQTATTRNNRLMGSYQFGFDWDMTKNDVITLSAKYGVRNQHIYQDDLQTISQTNNSLNTLRNVEITDNSGSIDMNIDYAHSFKKPQQILSVSTLYSRNDRENNFINSILKPQERVLENRNPSDNQEMTIQADFQDPIGDKQLIEIGGKGIFRRVKSDFTQIGNAGSLEYNQNVSSAYGTYTYATPSKYTFKLGGRYEYTTIDANQRIETAASTVTLEPYGVFVPSVNISKSLKSGSTIKIGYNRRIQRPSLQFLNPNKDRSNPLNITEGNPLLKPEYSNNYELTFNTFVKGTYLTSSFFVRNTKESIETIRENTKTENNQTITRTTFANVGNQDVYGLNLYGNIAILKKIQIGGGLDMFYAYINSNDPNKLNAKNEGFVLSGRVFGSYNFSNNWGLQAFGYFKGKQVQLQGDQGGFSLYSLSLKRDFNNKKGSVGIGAENFFTFNGFKVINNIQSDFIQSQNENTFYNMNFKVNFSYRFGKMSFGDSKKKTKSVNNDDQKDGSSNDASGGSMNTSNATPGQTPGAKQRPNLGPRPDSKSGDMPRSRP